MSDQLKTATAAAHQSLEAFLIPIIKQTYTAAEYVKLLRMFYGYYMPLEERIDRFAMEEVLPDYDQRRKAALILQDLKDLDAEEMPARCEQVPPVGSLAQAIGALYVLEGSTLGGQVITKILQRNLHTDKQEGFRFFTGYGAHTGVKWAEFRKVLESFCVNADAYQEIELAAKQTFTQLKTWAETCYRYEHTEKKL